MKRFDWFMNGGGGSHRARGGVKTPENELKKTTFWVQKTPGLSRECRSFTEAPSIKTRDRLGLVPNQPPANPIRNFLSRKQGRHHFLPSRVTRKQADYFCAVLPGRGAHAKKCEMT